MKKYDHIVVGSGASGLTATLLLALSGRKVLLLEKAPRPGGSLSRFRIDGIPFDTGFHFTGGLAENGLLRRMLKVLGIEDAVNPVFLSSSDAHHFVFENEQRVIELPIGIKEVRRRCKSDFPGDQTAVDRYFDLLEKVYLETASTDITRLGENSSRMDEEFITLKDVIDGITDNSLLKGVFCALGMCYGVRPSEVSFASHSRVCYDLYESTARFQNGGDAMVSAFQSQFSRLDVEVRLSSWITSLRENSAGHVDTAILNNGDEISFDSAILTIHPKQILEILPKNLVSRAFVQRIESFEQSIGFFTLFGTFEGEANQDFGSSIVSLYPTSDFDSMLDPAYSGEQALVIVGSREIVRNKPCHVAIVLEPSFPAKLEKWAGTSARNRPPDYLAYKEERVSGILKRLKNHDSKYGSNFRVMGAASVLTYRDYLNSPDGSAYGIKQKIGQYNLIGRLPVRNVFAAGQSALLPGIAGAMMSSFMVIRAMLGKENLGRLVTERLCN